MALETSNTFTSRDFRDALGKFATGVAIVASRTPDGADIGLTVSSLNAVSLDPPLILFSIARSAGSFSDWQRVAQFGVSILSEAQSELALRFSRPVAADKWRDVRVQSAGRVNARLIADAIAYLECELHAHHDGGDHLIVVGRVVNLQFAFFSGSSGLLFYEGRFRRLRPVDAER